MLTATAPVSTLPVWPDADALMGRLLHEVPSWSVQQDATLTAFAQFMAVCAASSVPRAPSPIIDEVWHVALLFTRDYREFCDREFDRFIDHSPLSGPPAPTTYADTRDLAESMFGSLDERLWPAAGFDAVADCDGGGYSQYTP